MSSCATNDGYMDPYCNTDGNSYTLIPHLFVLKASILVLLPSPHSIPAAEASGKQTNM